MSSHLTGVADVAQHGAAGLAWRGVPGDDSCRRGNFHMSTVPKFKRKLAGLAFWCPTVLADINADGVDVGDVGHGGPHGCTGGPHVVEEEHGHGGEAKNPEPGHSQNVREEHELATGHKISTREP